MENKKSIAERLAETDQSTIDKLKKSGGEAIKRDGYFDAGSYVLPISSVMRLSISGRIRIDKVGESTFAVLL